MSSFLSGLTSAVTGLFGTKASGASGASAASGASGASAASAASAAAPAPASGPAASGSSIGSWIMDGLTFTNWVNAAVVYFLIIGIIVAIVMISLKLTGVLDKPASAATANADTVASSLNAQVAGAAGTTSPAPAGTTTSVRAGAASTLVDAQPLTISHAGFLGPLQGGVFNAQDAVGQALRSGFRAFTLQIDYLDQAKDPKSFGEPGTPLLLFRDGNGTLTSKNSATIDSVAEAIASLAFRSEVPNAKQPVVLYLHVLRTPSPIRDPDEYLHFLSCIATALKSLAPMHLGMTPLGDFHRQKEESKLLTTPIGMLEGQVIVMTNVDTSLFRNPKVATQRYNPADDLDYWTNMRVYLGSDTKRLGVTTPAAPGAKPSAVIIDAGELLDLPKERLDQIAIQNKTRYSIALLDPMYVYTAKDIALLLASGFNLIPFNIFTGSLDQTKALVNEYNSESWRAKPDALQYPRTT